MEKQFVAFKVGSTFYCIDIMEVQEVIRESQITHMPNFPPFVEGVINLRGIITPLLSINKRLTMMLSPGFSFSDFDKKDEFDMNLSKLSEQPQTHEIPTPTSKSGYPLKLIIINVESISLGLLVDTLDKILTVDESQIQHAEGLGRSSNHKMVAGILQVDGEIYTVLDPRYVLENDETQLLVETLNQ